MTNNKQQDKSAFLLSLASYMGGIREGWRRMRGEVTKRTGDAKVWSSHSYIIMYSGVGVSYPAHGQVCSLAKLPCLC